MYSLEAKIRTATARETRESKMIPAVVYGKDTPSTSIQMGVSDFTRLYRETGKNHIISLSVDGKSYNVLVHDSQRHPVSGSFLHIDFLVVDMKAQVHVQIPVKLVGISPAVIEGGELHHLLHEVDVKCLPADMVDSFDLDISTIVHAGQLLHVSDISINAKKYTVITPADTAVVSVQTMKGQKEEDAATVAPADVAVVTAKEKAE